MSTRQPQWRCRVAGCSIENRWQPAATGVEADRASHAHYMRVHYQPAHAT